MKQRISPLLEAFFFLKNVSKTMPSLKRAPEVIAKLTPKTTSTGRPYALKTVPELINSLAVFKACSLPLLVNNSESIINSLSKVGLSSPVNFIIKNTIFNHFCGGESLTDTITTMKKFKQNNVGSILDLALEADLEASEKSGVDALKDTEKICAMFKQTIDIASNEPNSFIAVKATSLVPPKILLRLTNSLVDLKNKFSTIKREDMISSFNQSKIAFGNLDWIEFSNHVDGINKSTRNFFKLSINKSDSSLVTSLDFETLDLIMPEINNLVNYASSKNVKIMIDAEQTYFQPAIDAIVNNLAKIHNTQKTNVLNTYQLYLKDAFERLKLDMERADRLKISFGVKIVRGAYMISERERALELSYLDPINETLQDTHREYNNAIDLLLDKIALNNRVSFVVASHNKDSINHTREKMKELNISPNNNNVGFAQLMGMQDGLTISLGQMGYNVFKYIPYGPVHVTIPYLIRRAQENSSLMSSSGVLEDRKELFNELKRRII